VIVGGAQAGAMWDVGTKENGEDAATAGPPAAAGVAPALVEADRRSPIAW